MLNPCTGIKAPDEATATTMLRFGCPTQDALGKWHRCTIALSNVPVVELYTILSTLALIADRLKSLTEPLNSPEVRGELIRLEQLRILLKQQDQPRKP